MDIQTSLFIYMYPSRIRAQSFATVFQNVLLATRQIPILAFRKATEEQVPHWKSLLFIRSEIFKL